MTTTSCPAPPMDEDVSTDDERASLNEAMSNAIQSAMSDVYPGDLVTRFVVICESIDGQTSERALVTATTPNMKVWDALGLLQYALQKEQADAVMDTLSS